MKNRSSSPSAWRGFILFVLLVATSFVLYVVIARPDWVDLPFLPPKANSSANSNNPIEDTAPDNRNSTTLAPVMRPNSPFGMNIQSAARYGIYGSQHIPLNVAKEAGIAWNREEIRWDMVISPRTGQFTWEFSDEAINKSLNRGINVLILLAYNRDNSKTMPNLDEWSKYVSAVVNRYKDRVKHWQIWNEPDDNTFLRGASPLDYARLLARSYEVIKAIDPSAQVVTAGVSGFAVPWLEQMLAAGGAGKFDILAVHPYVSFPASPESKYWRENQLGYFLAFAARNGNPPVWITEIGWATAGNPASVSASKQADYIARAYVIGIAEGIQKLFMYQFRDEGANKADNFGLVGVDWRTPKLSYSVYKNLVARLDGAEFKQELDLTAEKRQPLDDFEQGADWGNGFARPDANIKLALSGEQKKSGANALKVEYSVAQQNDSYVQFGREIKVSNNPTKIGFWLYGNNSGAQVRILVKDSQDRLFYYEVGKIFGTGWKKYQAYLPGEAIAPSPQGQPSYPVRFDSIQITRQPDPKEKALRGTIYFDDFFVEEGAYIQAFRFEKSGNVIDVVWSEGTGEPVQLPTTLSQANLYTRNGASSRLIANNNLFSVTVTEEMQFIEHFQ
jgi:polysaccharide biosynthesis protein PslG